MSAKPKKSAMTGSTRPRLAPMPSAAGSSSSSAGPSGSSSGPAKKRFPTFKKKADVAPIVLSPEPPHADIIPIVLSPEPPHSDVADRPLKWRLGESCGSWGPSMADVLKASTMMGNRYYQHFRVTQECLSIPPLCRNFISETDDSFASSRQM